LTRGKIVLWSALFVVCLVLPGSAHVVAGDAAKSAPKIRKKAPKAPTPARPTGIVKRPDPVDAYYGGTRLDTITEYQNELGQTVYSIAASHFDISPPLLEMAAAAGPDDATEEEAEPSSNPLLPEWRLIRSDLPDPVVQVAVQPDDALTSTPFPLAAPTMGFNFAGVPIGGGTPSDSNGSVGNNQFVETVNTRYQVWSLNRSTQVATSILGPTNINTLWAGFGGACEAQNSGDPIVLYDKIANRWLISQFTSSAAGGVYYQCVAVSTTANATGAYARWAFAVPNGRFGDYPHFGVWQDAYYVMAHGFGGSFAAIFAAMDRARMLAGNPAATWLVINDPTEGGHMPADLDGFALPPSKAPGIFLSLHPEGMYIYRMKVSFVAPGSSSKTLQAIVPVAPATGACGGGTCIPQPGTGNLLDSIADRLMFRAAYRNFIDHESIVISHSVDPSVSGLVSGVRWYDFRISGTPNATCPTYPCLYQQGTVADVDNGRNRWMPSIAMDTAENILVGYSTSGKVAGSENHSSRYTGRAKGDPPGLMTVPETTIVTGTANNTGNSRWGDYTSMSVDPADDCTFWYVSQYYATQNAWSTRIASSVFPAGTGAGQCPVTTCTTRPASQPLIGVPTIPGDNQITVNWTGVPTTPGAYAIERADGACPTEGLFRPLAAVAGTTTSYTDTDVLGGRSYSYRVRAATDAAGKCQAILASGCASATATGTCNLRPSFNGITSATNSGQSNCGVTIQWASASSNCPLGPGMRYNIYRSPAPDFVPSAANRIATCVVGTGPYLDTDNLSSGTTYYYVVRAEDGTTGNGGACGGGNEDANLAVASATPFAAGTQPAPGTWTDGGGDGSATLTFGMTVSTGATAWRLVKTVDDPGANHTPGGAFAYRNAGPAANNTYPPFTCAQLQAPPLTVASSTVNLKYWERHQVEYHWDAIAVEYSVNGGPWTDVPAPSSSPDEGCDVSDDTTDWEPLSCTGFPAGNACGLPDTRNVFSGPLASGSSCGNFVTSAAVGPYAHRCHQITGLTPDDSIQFRWQFSSDEGAEYAGFYLDDVAVTNVRLPNVCAPDTCSGQANGTACSDGDLCTTGDSCSGGTCGGGPLVGCNDDNLCTADSCDAALGCVFTNNAVACDDGNPCTDGDACAGGLCAGTPIGAPAEVGIMSVAADKTTYTWPALAFATRYDAVRGEIAALPVGPGGGDESCFDDLPGPSVGDATVPAAGTGFWYLSRGASDCGGNGTYGQRSDGTLRVTTTCP
jgi:hypothetical protein